MFVTKSTFLKMRLGFCLALSLCLFFQAQPMQANSNAHNKSVSAQEADITVTGTVTGTDSNEPLIGATIQVKGTSTGTTTDFDGKYEITADENATMVISYTGYTTQEVPIQGRTQINIALEAASELLDEVVVVGYGTQKKREVTAAIASLTEEQITKIPVSSSVEAIQGQVAGVDIQQQGGRPGEQPTIRIRGRRSISASNDPLFVIDGIPQTGEGDIIGDINPQDIQSMEILKDAAATAIYGSRGANGVVLITTKRGSTGKAVVSYSGFYGVTSATATVDMMNGPEFAAMKAESRRRDANGNVAWNGTLPSFEEASDDPFELDSYQRGVDVDYQDLVLDDGWRTNHQLSIAGGSENTQYNVAVGYFNEQGILSNMDFERFTTRINLDQRINDIFKVGTSFLATRSIQNRGSTATIGEAISNNPLGQPFDEAGNLRFLPTNDGIRTNPLNELVENAFVDERKVTRIFAPIYLEAKILDGLNYRANFGPDIRLRRDGQFRASLTNNNRGGPADADIDNRDDFGYTLENIVTYSKSLFGGSHKLKLTGLQSIQSFRREENGISTSNLPYETQLFYNVGTAEVINNVSSLLEEWSLVSFLGRINYDIAGKYLFQASLRADGSSRLSEGNKWQSFPGVSVGWRIADEPFMQGGIFDDLKLRASYGEVGNTSIDPYQTAGALARTTYAWNESPALGFRLNEIPNADLGWEVSKTLDIGLDFDLLSGRINGAIDWYRTNTEDLLLERNLPYTSGYNFVFQNIGSTRTQGIELFLNAGVVNTPNFSWDINFNIASYTEEITELALTDENGNPTDDVGNRWFIGQPLRAYFDYEKIGIWQANEVDQAKTVDNAVPGEIKVADRNGNGVIDPDDRTILGSDVPDYYGGITNNFNIYGFDFSFFFFFRQGHTIKSNFHEGNNSLFARYNNLDVDYWTVDNPTNAFPRPNENQERPRYNNTMSYFDGSFIKLRNVTLGYNLPSSVLDKINMSSLRLYVSGQNLWFISDFDTFDPEGDDPDLGDIPEIGSGTRIIPSTRVFLIGVNAKF